MLSIVSFRDSHAHTMSILHFRLSGCRRIKKLQFFSSVIDLSIYVMNCQIYCPFYILQLKVKLWQTEYFVVCFYFILFLFLCVLYIYYVCDLMLLCRDDALLVDSAHIGTRTVGILRRDLMELQCLEEKLISLLKLVEEPLEKLGSNRPLSSISELTDFGSVVILLFIVYCDEMFVPTHPFRRSIYLDYQVCLFIPPSEIN